MNQPQTEQSMEVTVNTTSQTQCQVSYFSIYKASEGNRFAKELNSQMELHHIASSSADSIHLNAAQKKARVQYPHPHTVFITTEDPLEAVAPSKPLAHFNAAVHDAVGFAVFCGLSIVTGTVVWASFI